MPTFRSINISLHSQFDVGTLPEYYPAPLEHYITRDMLNTTPRPVDDASSTCSVFVPVLAGSTFWISYSVSPPVPDAHHFLFKLYINGVHIVNWSVGKKEAWRGKTMFGLYARPEDEEGKRRVEKRALCFMPPNNMEKAQDGTEDRFDERICMEIKVHRAHGRKRVERDLQEYSRTEHAKDEKGIRLVEAGCASSEQPKRFYNFALIDPVDQPFATFKYFYRTWEQLRDLGPLSDGRQSAGEENDMSVIEPDEESIAGDEARGAARASDRETEDVVHDCGDGAVDPRAHDAPIADSEQKRWSSIRCVAGQAQTVRPLPATPRQSTRNGIATPPLEKRKGQGLRAASLLNVISSTWTRLGTRPAGTDSHGGAGSRSGARSVS